MSSIIRKARFVDCSAGERGGALTWGGGAARIEECEFAKCRVEAAAATEQCVRLTMKTSNSYDMWGGAVLFLVGSDGFASVADLVAADLECSSPNEFCLSAVGCKCTCDSHAEAVLAKNSIAKFMSY